MRRVHHVATGPNWHRSCDFPKKGAGLFDRHCVASSDRARRGWANVDGFIQEVANARVHDGVHICNSTEVGTAMVIKVGE